MLVKLHECDFMKRVNALQRNCQRMWNIPGTWPIYMNFTSDEANAYVDAIEERKPLFYWIMHKSITVGERACSGRYDDLVTNQPTSHTVEFAKYSTEPIPIIPSKSDIDHMMNDLAYGDSQRRDFEANTNRSEPAAGGKVIVGIFGSPSDDECRVQYNINNVYDTEWCHMRYDGVARRLHYAPSIWKHFDRSIPREGFPI